MTGLLLPGFRSETEQKELIVYWETILKGAVTLEEKKSYAEMVRFLKGEII